MNKRKKILVSVILMIVFTVGCEINPIEYEDWRPAETLVYLNIRTGPGREFEWVDTIPPGMGIYVSNESRGVFEIWRKIQISDEEYWVCEGTIYDDYFVLLN